jgi:para-nitrobenzyl esterase
VDLLAGTNLNEASSFIELAPATGAPAPTEQLCTLAEEDFGDDAEPAIADYRDVLRGELGAEPTPKQLLESYLSDRLYRQPTNRLLAARAGSRGVTYAYLFTWPSPAMEGRLGSCHALEVPFVFRQLHRPEAVTLVGDDPPQQLSDWMSDAWIRFAATGHPSSAGLPEWPAYEPAHRATMALDVTPSVLRDPRGGLRTFWEERRR